MRTWSVPLFLALLISPVVVAASDSQAIPFGDADNIVVPANSPVHFSGIQNEPDSTATFNGRFLLAGTYYYGDSAFNDSGDEHLSDYVFEPQAYIIPDDDVVALLPHFERRNQRPVIFIKNPATFAKAVLSKSAALQVRCRTCGDVTGHIAIWVDQFGAGIVCDSASYGVRFVSVYKTVQSAFVPAPTRAC